uniref:Uncharacterized protein n=1 Tax=Caenorhabditis japonica TaxID=281687 RepID=A0A8R1IR12_CAEJA
MDNINNINTRFLEKKTTIAYSSRSICIARHIIAGRTGAENSIIVTLIEVLKIIAHIGCGWVADQPEVSVLVVNYIALMMAGLDTMIFPFYTEYWSFLILISLLVSLCYHWPDLSNRTCIHCVYDYRDIFPPHLMHFLAAVCTVFLLMTLVLLLINHCKLRKKTYSLAIEFQINQNLRVLHLALPVSFWTFLAFFWWIGLSYFVGSDADLDAEIEQFHKMVQNVSRRGGGGASDYHPVVSNKIIGPVPTAPSDKATISIHRTSQIFPVYTFLTSLTWLLLMYIEKKKKRVGMVPPETSKVEKDMYFQSLNEQWSRMPSQTQKTGRLNLLNVFAVPRSSVAS